MEGQVKWFNSAKGYGFITATDGEDIFVHFSGISGDGFKALVEGDKVNFEVTPHNNGVQAINVTKI